MTNFGWARLRLCTRTPTTRQAKLKLYAASVPILAGQQSLLQVSRATCEWWAFIVLKAEKRACHPGQATSRATLARIGNANPGNLRGSEGITSAIAILKSRRWREQAQSIPFYL